MKTSPLLRYRLPVLIFSALLLVAVSIPLGRLKINSDLESYMPETMKSKTSNRAISEYFSSDENLLLVIEAPDILATSTLQRMSAISEQLQQLPMVTRVHSLFQTQQIHSEEGFMQVDPVIQFIPETEEEREQLRSELLSNDLAAGLVVSTDFRNALMIVDVERDTSATNADETLIQQVRALIAGTSGPENIQDSAGYAGTSGSASTTVSAGTACTSGPEIIRMTGQPYLRYDANKKISRDILVLLPLGLLLMLVFLWFSFRDLKSVLLPFSVVIFSILFSMALLPLFGWELSLIGILIPILMIAIANNYGVHVIARYQELRQLKPLSDHTELVSRTVRYLSKPVWLCGLTTVAGTLGLTAHVLIPARQMGIVAALGIAFALFMSLTYLPALMSYFNPSGKQHSAKNHFSVRLLARIADHSVQHPRAYIAVGVLFLLTGIAGMLHLTVAPDSSKVLPSDHEFNQAIRIADEQFGGSKMLQIMIEGDARDPLLLRQIDSVATEIEKNPLTGHTASLATMLRKMNSGALPTTREAVAQNLELYGFSADVADYERFIDFGYTHSLLTVQYRSASLKEAGQLTEQIEALLRQQRLNYEIGGPSLIDKEISESVRTGQIASLIAALAAIVVLLSVIFKSVMAGLLGSIPLAFSVLCTFGFMGWTGIELDIVTALLSSVSIGLGVDFTIHLFWRLKFELQQDADWKQAIRNSLKGTGRGITINAFSVMIGFSVLLFSSFPFVRSFGILIILSLLLCLMSALLLLPAICLLVKPRFLISKT